MPKFSLAFGWGAVRWLAHIWVIQYLEEYNLKASEVSGTSIGAIIAALYAFGKTSTEMRTICSEIKYLKLIDVDLKKWLISGNKIRDFFQMIFGELKIEDLKMPLKIISTNINTGERYVFDKGLIVDAIRSSISIPGVIMPNKMWDNEFVDGGIVNNLPVEVLHNRNIITISVLRDISRPLETNYKLLGFELKHNMLWMGYQILQKSIDIMMEQNERKSLETKKNLISLHPIFPWIDYYEFHKYDEIIKMGYETAVNMKLIDQMKNTFKM